MRVPAATIAAVRLTVLAMTPVMRVMAIRLRVLAPERTVSRRPMTRVREVAVMLS